MTTDTPASTIPSAALDKLRTQAESARAKALAAVERLEAAKVSAERTVADLGPKIEAAKATLKAADDDLAWLAAYPQRGNGVTTVTTEATEAEQA